jgi:triacylglycerol lipase
VLPIIPIVLLALEIGLCSTVLFKMFGDNAMQRLGELSFCVMLWLLLARLAAVLLTFWYSGHFNRVNALNGLPNVLVSQTGRQWLGTVSHEYLTAFVAFTLPIPFRWFFAPRVDKKVTNNATIVLLVHGLISNSGVWWYFARGFKKQNGMHVDSLDLGPAFESIDQYVLRLNERIELLNKLSPSRIVLVGHSMGGLVCRAWLASHEPNKVSQLITLGTPHQGSQTARWFWASNLVQMRPLSAWLTKLATNTKVMTHCLYSVHDNLVVPYEFGQLLGCTNNQQLIGLGHLSLLFDRQVRERVVKLIDERSVRH